MSIILPKHSDTYVFADYLDGRATRRCKELTDADPVQIISRRKEDGAPVLALVKASYWDSYFASYSAVSAAPWAYRTADRTDDFLGGNISTLSWLLNAQPEVKNEIPRIVQEGTSNLAFEVCPILNTKKYSVQAFAAGILGVPKGGEIMAYLISHDMYLGMQQSPVATIYAGTGTGSIEPSLSPGYAVAETITVTCTSAVPGGGVFSVVGSVSGALGSATVGTLFESLPFKCLISDGGVDFIVGDVFTVNSRAAIL
jgi:hypothetical protein